MDVTTRRCSPGLGLAALAWTATACGGPPTFNRDVAPIVFQHCASCHRPEGIAPFSLLGYEDVRSRARPVVEETGARRMPPWLPDPGAFPILGDRRLSEAQIGVIRRWVEAGAIEGDPADRRPAPVRTDAWELGEPDFVARAAAPYRLASGRADVYRNLVLPTSLDTTAYVRAVEFRTHGAPIHHAVIRVDPTSSSRRRDGADGNAGFDGMGWSIQDPDGHFIGWAPGRGPIVAPDGMPWRLERGADLVVEVHVIPGDEAVPVQPSVGLYLTDTPPAETPVTVKMGSKAIDIPAGAREYVVTDTYELPVAVDLMSVYPHAHYLGRDMQVTATRPDGKVLRLLHIRQWSFHWQQDYRYVTPVALPVGTRLVMRYTYDNSSENHHNPHHPPKRVRAGPESTDEMAELGLQLMPKSRADAKRLVAEFDERERRANVALGETRVREEPEVGEYRAFLGGSYADAGRYAEAVPHLEEAVRLGERTASTYTYLGAALMGLGRPAEALGPFQRAAALSPQDEVMHFNIGHALTETGRFAEAEAAFRRSLALNADYPDAHVNLGRLLFARRRVNEAIGHFERAAARQPDSALIHSNLGGALAAAGRYAEAMTHVRRALEIDPDYGPARDNLARLRQLGIR